MIKYFMIAMMLVGTCAASECANGKCRLNNSKRVVRSSEVMSYPATNRRQVITTPTSRRSYRTRTFVR